MTGYGEGEYISQKIHLKIDIKSLNHKKLEIFGNVPFFLQFLETDIRKIISDKIKRGKINYFIKVFYWERETEVYIDQLKVKALVSKMNEIANEMNSPIEFDLKTLLSIPEIIVTKEKDIDRNEALKILKPALDDCITSLNRSRAIEGGYLLNDIRESIKIISGTIDEIISLKQEALETFKENYKKKITKLINDYSNELDQNRLYQEMAFLIDKSDIQEEITRLNSHLNQLSTAFSGKGEPIGKAVNFLLQEMNREANTLGVKCSYLPIIQKNLLLKEEIEKIREQIQNVE